MHTMADLMQPSHLLSSRTNKQHPSFQIEANRRTLAQSRRRLTNSNRARPARQLCPIRKRLCNHEHVLLKVAHPIPLARPEVEVVARRNRPADAAHRLLRLALHAKVLRKRPRSFDGRLVDTLRSIERIVIAVGRVVASECPGLAGRKNVP
jgi:hypothetical protein